MPAAQLTSAMTSSTTSPYRNMLCFMTIVYLKFFKIPTSIFVTISVRSIGPFTGRSFGRNAVCEVVGRGPPYEAQDANLHFCDHFSNVVGRGAP